MTRRAGHGLRQHAALAVEHAGREVAALAHDRRERRAHQHLRLLLHHRDQAVPHDLQVDEFRCVGHAYRPPLHHDAAGRVDARIEARRDECRCLVLGDDRRARHAHAGLDAARADRSARRWAARAAVEERAAAVRRGRALLGGRASAIGRCACVEISTDQLSTSIAAPGIGRWNSTEYPLSNCVAQRDGVRRVRSRTGSGTVISCPCPT